MYRSAFEKTWLRNLTLLEQRLSLAKAGRESFIGKR